MKDSPRIMWEKDESTRILDPRYSALSVSSVANVYRNRTQNESHS
jgi:hypothetical protein